jgi:hypothetical protein
LSPRGCPCSSCRRGFIIADDETPPEYTQWLYRPGHWDEPELIPFDLGAGLLAMTDVPLPDRGDMAGC